MTDDTNVYPLPLTARPVKGELARLLKRLHHEIHPDSLTVKETLSLLHPLRAITKRLDAEK
jgi:hypothetical protein